MKSNSSVEPVTELVQGMERRDSLPQIAANLPTPISLPSTQPDPLALPPPIPSSSSSLPIESTKKEIKEVNKDNDLNKQAKATNPNRKALRMGSEGEEVREMQEALLKLGFYSGEEEMEFSSFSTGTQRAVKTWQATFGAPEDGIMTEHLYICSNGTHVIQGGVLRLSGILVHGGHSRMGCSKVEV